MCVAGIELRRGLEGCSGSSSRQTLKECNGPVPGMAPSLGIPLPKHGSAPTDLPWLPISSGTKSNNLGQAFREHLWPCLLLLPSHDPHFRPTRGLGTPQMHPIAIRLRGFEGASPPNTLPGKPFLRICESLSRIDPHPLLRPCNTALAALPLSRTVPTRGVCAEAHLGSRHCEPHPRHLWIPTPTHVGAYTPTNQHIYTRRSHRHRHDVSVRTQTPGLVETRALPGASHTHGL